MPLCGTSENSAESLLQLVKMLGCGAKTSKAKDNSAAIRGALRNSHPVSLQRLLIKEAIPCFPSYLSQGPLIAARPIQRLEDTPGNEAAEH